MVLKKEGANGNHTTKSSKQIWKGPATKAPSEAPLLHSVNSTNTDRSRISLLKTKMAIPISLIYIDIQFSRSVVSNSLWPHGLSTPGCPVHHQLRWCHPTTSSSVVPFSSCLQSFPESRSFPMSQFFTSGGQSIGASASVLPMNIQDWFPLRWLVGSPCSPRDS